MIPDGRGKILLVEDNPDDAELTMRALRKAEIDRAVLHVDDGVKALDYIFRTGPFAGRTDPDPCFILLDLKLPRIDGIEVLRRLKSDANARMVPVIVLTSSREERDISESYRLGVNSYIVKPIDYPSLMRVVGQLGDYWLNINQSLISSG
jgi:two-component system response regulator